MCVVKITTATVTSVAATAEQSKKSESQMDGLMNWDSIRGKYADNCALHVVCEYGHKVPG